MKLILVLAVTALYTVVASWWLYRLILRPR